MPSSDSPPEARPKPKRKKLSRRKTTKKNPRLPVDGLTVSSRKICKGRMTVGNQEGIFLKGLRSHFTERLPLNEENAARKDEDLCRLIDFGLRQPKIRERRPEILDTLGMDTSMRESEVRSRRSRHLRNVSSRKGELDENRSRLKRFPNSATISSKRLRYDDYACLSPEVQRRLSPSPVTRPLVENRGMSPPASFRTTPRSSHPIRSSPPLFQEKSYRGRKSIHDDRMNLMRSSSLSSGTKRWLPSQEVGRGKDHSRGSSYAQGRNLGAEVRSMSSEHSQRSQPRVDEWYREQGKNYYASSSRQSFSGAQNDDDIIPGTPEHITQQYSCRLKSLGRMKSHGVEKITPFRNGTVATEKYHGRTHSAGESHARNQGSTHLDQRGTHRVSHSMSQVVDGCQSPLRRQRKQTESTVDLDHLYKIARPRNQESFVKMPTRYQPSPTSSPGGASPLPESLNRVNSSFCPKNHSTPMPSAKPDLTAAYYLFQERLDAVAVSMCKTLRQCHRDGVSDDRTALNTYYFKKLRLLEDSGSSQEASDHQEAARREYKLTETKRRIKHDIENTPMVPIPNYKKLPGLLQPVRSHAFRLGVEKQRYHCNY